MGMDVYGKAPSAPEDDYFGNTAFCFFDLWSLACQVSESARLVRHGFTNDYDGLDAARKLASDLRAAVDDGRAAEFERNLAPRRARHRAKWETTLASLRDSNRASVRGFCGEGPGWTFSRWVLEFADFLDPSGTRTHLRSP
jgi:hypothetical protein